MRTANIWWIIIAVAVSAGSCGSCGSDSDPPSAPDHASQVVPGAMQTEDAAPAEDAASTSASVASAHGPAPIEPVLCKPDNRDGIGGGYAPERIQKRMRRAHAAITTCVERSLLINPSLVGSQIRTKLSIRRERVRSVRVRALDPDLEVCVGDALKKLRLSWRDVTDAPEIPYNFTIATSADSDTDTDSAAPPAAEVLWLEEVIGERLSAPDSPITDCLTAALEAQPPGYGRVRVDVSVDDAGRVSESAVSNTSDEAVAACIRAGMTKLEPFSVRPDDDRNFYCSTQYGRAPLPEDAPVLYLSAEAVTMNGAPVTAAAEDAQPTDGAAPTLTDKLREIAEERRLLVSDIDSRTRDEARALLILRAEDDVPLTRLQEVWGTLSPEVAVIWDLVPQHKADGSWQTALMPQVPAPLVESLGVVVGSEGLWTRRFEQAEFQPHTIDELSDFVREHEGQRFDLEVSPKDDASYRDLVRVLRALAPVSRGVRVLNSYGAISHTLLLP